MAFIGRHSSRLITSALILIGSALPARSDYLWPYEAVVDKLGCLSPWPPTRNCVNALSGNTSTYGRTRDNRVNGWPVAFPFGNDSIGGSIVKDFLFALRDSSDYPTVRILAANVCAMAHSETCVNITLASDRPLKGYWYRLWAPSRSGQANLAYQCHQNSYEKFNEAGSQGVNTVTLSFNTNVSRCDGDSGRLSRAERPRLDKTINNGDFYSPMRIIVLGNNRPVAFVKCSIPDQGSTRSCSWSYPSINRPKNQYLNWRYYYRAPDNSSSAAADLGWLDASAGVTAGRIVSRINSRLTPQELPAGQSDYSTIYGQVIAVLMNACYTLPPRLSPTSDTAMINFALGCITAGGPNPALPAYRYPASLLYFVGRNNPSRLHPHMGIPRFLGDAIRADQQYLSSMSAALRRIGAMR